MVILNTPDIRSAQGNDLEAMALITARANAQLEGQTLPETVSTSDESFINLQTRMAKPGLWAYVALDGQNVVSYVLGYPSSEEASLPSNPSVEYLALLMADPNYEGRGFASRLLDIAATEARGRSRRQLALWTGQVNTHARQVYEHKGYKLGDETRVSELRGPQVLYLLDL